MSNERYMEAWERASETITLLTDLYDYCAEIDERNSLGSLNNDIFKRVRKSLGLPEEWTEQDRRWKAEPQPKHMKWRENMEKDEARISQLEPLAKARDQIRNIVDICRDDPISQTDRYFRGYANGLILALATLDGEEPEFFGDHKQEQRESLEDVARHIWRNRRNLTGSDWARLAAACGLEPSEPQAAPPIAPGSVMFYRGTAGNPASYPELFEFDHCSKSMTGSFMYHDKHYSAVAYPADDCEIVTAEELQDMREVYYQARPLPEYRWRGAKVPQWLIDRLLPQPKSTPPEGSIDHIATHKFERGRNWPEFCKVCGHIENRSCHLVSDPFANQRS